MSLFQPQGFKTMETTDKEILKQNVEPLMKKYQMDSEIVLKELLHFQVCISYQADILDPKQGSFIDIIQQIPEVQEPGLCFSLN